MIARRIYKTSQLHSTITFSKMDRSGRVSTLWLCSLCQTYFVTFALIALNRFWQSVQVLLTAAIHLEKIWNCLYVMFWWMEWKLAFQVTFQVFASSDLGTLEHPEKKKKGCASIMWKISAVLRRFQMRWHPHSYLLVLCLNVHVVISLLSTSTLQCKASVYAQGMPY